MEFQEKLLKVGQALSRDEVKALAFLCADLLKHDLSSVDYARDIFTCLADQDLLSADQPYILADLLSVIGRLRLLREFDLYGQISGTRSPISAYRKMLYKLSEEITGPDLKAIKFLLTKDLQRTALEPDVSTLDIFLEMERKDLISCTNLNLLETIMQTVCPMLLRNIQEFKASNGKLAQEIGLGHFRPRSSSDVPTATKTLTSLPDRPASGEITGFGEYPDKLLPQLSSVHLSNAPLVCSTENKTSGPQHSQATETKEEALGLYPMVGQQRGVCWIVNNYDFTNTHGRHRNREGTHFDEQSLVSVFTWLGFEVKVSNDCTRSGMLSSVQELCSRDHSRAACIACCILSHGREGAVYGVDGEPIPLKELTEPFSGSRCASLRGKPKLFFIQACQGNQEQQAVYIQSDSPETSHISSDAVVLRESVPCGADFLMAMATVPSFVSLRDKRQGSWFIQSLCQNMVQMVPHGHDLVSILTKVNNDVSKMIDPYRNRRQMPQPAFSLRKKVVFPIPEDPPPSLQKSQ